MVLWLDYLQSGDYHFVILNDSCEKGDDEGTLLLAISPEDNSDMGYKVDSLYLYDGLVRDSGYDVAFSGRLKIIGVDII